MRPSRPEPSIAVGSRSCSSTSLRTAGPILFADADERSAGAAALTVTDAAGCAAGFGGGAAAFGAAEAAGAALAAGAAAAAVAATGPGSRIASNWPLFTTAPSAATICLMMPSTGAGTSSTTLSVSRSTRFSSRRTESPGFLCQATSVASATDSGSCGTLTSMLTNVLPWRFGAAPMLGAFTDRGKPRSAFFRRRCQRRCDQRLLLADVQRMDAGRRRGCTGAPCVEQLVRLAERLLQAMANLVPRALVLRLLLAPND